ncbi:MAPEG family protein [Ferrovibrio sp.]|uniref:MAPEG family protein n=1 Tax=Ferrovibrio sp. TaxID=1917215 RepID=UPI001B534133|nr:MAPEG family protein [Ferrovibrio sp.]MBP7062730.1 MAPEG family protein [Ferrovibrio sp.]
MPQNFVIIPIYAALLGLLLLALTTAVVRLRGKHKVGIGDGGHADLALACRAHANFIEYVPLALILLLLLEYRGVPVWALHGLGAGLFLGRVLHAWGLSRSQGTSPGRAIGILLTWISILVPSLWLLVISFT